MKVALSALLLYTVLGGGPGCCHPDSGKKRRMELLVGSEGGAPIAFNVSTFQGYDLLCEWALNGAKNFSLHTLQENVLEKKFDEEMAKLLSKCEFFEREDDIAQCKFYVFAIPVIFDEEEILEKLNWVDGEDGEMAYKRCGQLTVKLNDMIENGLLSGVEIAKEKDAHQILTRLGPRAHHVEGDDYFELDEPLDETRSENYKRESMQSLVASPSLGTVVSIGSILSSLIGATLVRVCRRFDVVTYALVR